MARKEVEQGTVDAVLDIIKPLWSATPLKGAQIGERLGISDAVVRECVAILRRAYHPIAGEVSVGYFYARARGDLDKTRAEYHARVHNMLEVDRALGCMQECLNSGMTTEQIRDILTADQLSFL